MLYHLWLYFKGLCFIPIHFKVLSGLAAWCLVTKWPNLSLFISFSYGGTSTSGIFYSSGWPYKYGSYSDSCYKRYYVGSSKNVRIVVMDVNLDSTFSSFCSSSDDYLDVKRKYWEVSMFWNCDDEISLKCVCSASRDATEFYRNMAATATETQYGFSKKSSAWVGSSFLARICFPWETMKLSVSKD